jgi:hypothetical protein
MAAWQMECCGEPYAVGDEVEWALDDDPDRDWLEAALGAELASQVTHEEEHHRDLPEGTTPAKGTVRAIRCAYGRYAPTPADQRVLYPVPGSAELTAVARVDGTEASGSPLNFNGYLVDLELDTETT